MNAKPWWQSKTMWINGLTAAATMGGEVSGLLPPSVNIYLIPALAVLNILLRAVTTQPVTMAAR